MTASDPVVRPALELTGEATSLRTLVHDLRRHLHLLPLLARQDFTARYRSASLGMAWSLFLPMLQGAVLAVVFTRIVPIRTGGSYPVFVFAGLNTWNFLSTSVSTGSTAIADTSSLASRVYFPRLLLPAMPAAAQLPAYAISNTLLLVLMAVFGTPFTWRLLLLPVVMAAAVLLAVGVAAIASLLHVYFRDVRYAVTASLLVLFYATPVIYPLDRAHRLRDLIVANPATGLVQAVRWTVFGRATSAGSAVAVTAGWLVAVLAVALLSYRKYERIAVDRL